MCLNHYLDEQLLCLLCYIWINLDCKFTEKVILQVEIFHFHCHPHVPSCMCLNRYWDGNLQCLLCYTWINLVCKLY